MTVALPDRTHNLDRRRLQPRPFGGVNCRPRQDIAAVAIEMRIDVVEPHQLYDLRRPLQDLAQIFLLTPTPRRPLRPAAHAVLATRRPGDSADRQSALGESINISHALHSLHRFLHWLSDFACSVKPSDQERPAGGAPEFPVAVAMVRIVKRRVVDGHDARARRRAGRCRLRRSSAAVRRLVGNRHWRPGFALIISMHALNLWIFRGPLPPTFRLRFLQGMVTNSAGNDYERYQRNRLNAG